MLRKNSVNVVSVDCMIGSCIDHAAPLCSLQALAANVTCDTLDPQLEERTV